MMHFPLTPHHVQLISACYPPSAALLTSGPEYKPNSQELSRLTYYASNHPGKITKLSTELQKRITADCRKARGGNTRSRSSLLITLNIYKALVTECRRDITLLSSALMASLDCTLSSLPGDLEVAAKTATVFTAWATYTTGQLLGVDALLTRDYFATLRKFHALSVMEVKKGDYEDRNRTRLIGLGALTGAVTSEALYNSASQFKPQAAILVSAFLSNILQTNLETLENQVENIKNFPVPLNPYLSDFRTRPLLERRAASIHVHVEGDKGPSMADVANSALRAFTCLFSSANALQIGSVTQALFDSLGVQNSWGQTEHCCWIIQRAVEWAQYQYRFAVPIRLVERLAEAQDDPYPSDLHLTLSAMIKAVFTSTTPLVNLSTSDIMANLTALILRRIIINVNDGLIPELVECIGSLGTHLYYADQIHDLACELIGRILSIEMNGLPGRGRSGSKRNDEKAMALRSLVSALEKLLQTSSESQNALPEDPNNGNVISLSATISDSNRTITPNSVDGAPSTNARPNRTHRTKIPPDVWQETLILLCDESFAVRADYFRALTTFLRLELLSDTPSLGEHPEKDGIKRAHHLESGPYRRAISISSVAAKSSRTYRFLHALHAFTFVALTCPCLSIPSFPPSPSRSLDGDHSEAVHVNVVPSTPLHDEHSSGNEDSQDTSQTSQSSRRKSVNITPQTRKIALIRRLMGQSTTHSAPDLPSSATANDFSFVLSVLTIIHERVSSRALFTGVPMLAALERWCSDECRNVSDSTYRCRRRAIRELVLRSWLVISNVWDCKEIAETISEALSKCRLVLDNEASSTAFPALEEEIPLTTLDVDDPEDLRVDPYLLISHLSKSRNVQYSTGMDEESLCENLNGSWSPEGAMKNSMNRAGNGDVPRPESINPVLKISPALMHISNMSLQSLTRSARAVGVNDLREALEGRRSLSNLALSQARAPSVSSFGAATYSAGSGEESNISRIFRPERPKRRLLDGESPREVRDMLDKLGIGAKNGANLLKTSLSSRQKSSKGSVLVPPYKN